MAKEDFLGIGARFFLFVNLFKVPFIWDADVITKRTLLIDLAPRASGFSGYRDRASRDHADPATNF